MRYLFIFLLLFACSKTTESEIEDPLVFSSFQNKTYDELAITYKVDAPTMGIVGAEISKYKKKDIVKFQYNEFTYFPSTKRVCSGEVCRGFREGIDPDMKIIVFSSIFKLNELNYNSIEYQGTKIAGERSCHRYYITASAFDDYGEIMDICIDEETTVPLYATILKKDIPAIIWTVISVENSVNASMFE